MFRLDLKKPVAYRATNTKTSGAFRLETYKVFKDSDGLYIIKRKIKIYLTPENCVNI